MRVMGISGSLRKASYNSLLVREASRVAPVGLVVAEWRGIRAIPAYDEDLEENPPLAVVNLRNGILEADALFFSTPEYNGSIPGALKNALDWASRPYPASSLRNVPCAVAGVSTGLFGAAWARAELRKVLTTSGAYVVDAELGINLAEEAFTADGRLVDGNQVYELQALVGALIDARQESGGCVRRVGGDGH
jgi:chromate reductase